MKAGSAHEYVLDTVLPWMPSAHWKWKYLACTWIWRIFVCLFCWIFVFNFFALRKKRFSVIQGAFYVCLRNALENSFHIIFSLQYHKSPQSHLQHAQSLQRAGKDTGAFSANKQDLFPQELLAVLSTRLFYRMHCSVLFPPNYPKYFDSVAFLSFMLFLLPCLVSAWAVMVLIITLQML